MCIRDRPWTCSWVREQLFEWFIAMRYSVDWKKYNEALRSRGRYKAMGRFPAPLLYWKARQFLLEYLRARCEAGVRAVGMRIHSKWMKRWCLEYGLSLRAPNRKYKVAKRVLEERLQIGWLNCARVRKLCQLVFGYDPEQENWDQSPFQHNEIGSQNSKTLAVRGCVVPLIEGHADTRARWTANLTTFSNGERIMNGELPYAECMFKADGEQVARRLREHVRSSGHGSWLSVATSEKASYREADVLDFLETHLPEKTPERRWRIIWGDDARAHKTENAKRLAWHRGYVLLLHGGGATPVVQTPDTDLNQHVRRKYTELESVHILEEMRKGVGVPKTKHTQCIDMMAQVLSDSSLHLQAAAGYKSTGLTVALNGTEDHRVTREAGNFFRSLNMREKINREVAIVEQEYKAGRLRWTYEDVHRLIQPYPARQGDDVLQAIGEHHFLDEGDTPFETEEYACGASEADSAVAESERDVAEDVAEETDEASGEEEPDAVAAGELGMACDDDVPDASEVEVVRPALSPAHAERLENSQALVAAYKQAIDVLTQYGAMPMVGVLELEVKKEQRRQRIAANEAPAVAAALADLEAAKAADERRHRLAIQDVNRRAKENAELQKAADEAKALLKKRKRELLSLEGVLESKHALKRYTPESLGQGKSRGGKVAEQKLRYEVLERIASLGTGLTPAQKNDWRWFRETWDAKMCSEHGADWGGIFSGWMQKILDDLSKGVSNAFSVFVHDETRRHFEDVPMLTVPSGSA